MTWVATILTAVLRVLIPVLLDQLDETSVDASMQTTIRDTLRARIKSHWVRASVGLVLAACVMSLIAGCGSQTVYVPDGAPVRLRETIKNAEIWVMTDDGDIVAGKMDIPEGWYALPLDEGDD